MTPGPRFYFEYCRMGYRVVDTHGEMKPIPCREYEFAAHLTHRLNKQYDARYRLTGACAWKERVYR